MTLVKKDPKSPCNESCRIMKSHCIGCKRTLKEIGSWSKSTDEQKKEILEAIKLR